MSSSEPIKKAKGDRIDRGSRESSPIGTALWLTLRGLDPFLQHALLAKGLASSLLHRVGLQTVSLLKVPSSTTGISFIDQLGLSNHQLVLLLMATGSSVKQIYWHLFCSLEPMPAELSVPVSILNTTFNSLNSLLLTWTLTSAAVSDAKDNSAIPISLSAGLALYLVGIFTEAISERQRKAFKDDPKNKGKCFTGGLFSLARHINYGGYTIWRTGYSIAAGGWIWGTVLFSLIMMDWTSRGVPALDHYCQQRVSVSSSYMLIHCIHHADKVSGSTVPRTMDRIQEEDSIQASSLYLLVTMHCSPKSQFLN